ncbi:hypothetical protein ES707_22368 [subsurface metagenome]
MNKYTLPIIAVILIACLEVVALSLGVNGLGLSLSIGSICTIVGWTLGSLKKRPYS